MVMKLPSRLWIPTANLEKLRSEINEHGFSERWQRGAVIEAGTTKMFDGYIWEKDNDGLKLRIENDRWVARRHSTEAFTAIVCKLSVPCQIAGIIIEKLARKNHVVDGDYSAELTPYPANDIFSSEWEDWYTYHRSVVRLADSGVIDSGAIIVDFNSGEQFYVKSMIAAAEKIAPVIAGLNREKMVIGAEEARKTSINKVVGEPVGEIFGPHIEYLNRYLGWLSYQMLQTTQKGGELIEQRFAQIASLIGDR